MKKYRLVSILVIIWIGLVSFPHIVEAFIFQDIGFEKPEVLFPSKTVDELTYNFNNIIPYSLTLSNDDTPTSIIPISVGGVVIDPNTKQPTEGAQVAINFTAYPKGGGRVVTTESFKSTVNHDGSYDVVIELPPEFYDTSRWEMYVIQVGIQRKDPNTSRGYSFVVPPVFIEISSEEFRKVLDGGVLIKEEITVKRNDPGEQGEPDPVPNPINPNPTPSPADIDFPAIKIDKYNLFFSTPEGNTSYTTRFIPLEGKLKIYLEHKYYTLEDEDKFIEMVQQWIREHHSVLTRLGITNINGITPVQGAILAGELVMDKLEYGWPEEDAFVPQGIDKVLNGKKGVCAHYSEATNAVFDILKKLYPEKLRNTYMQVTYNNFHSHVLHEITHGYNALYNLKKSNEVTVTQLDFTKADKGNSGPDYTKERIPDFLNNLFRQGLLSREITLKYIEEVQREFPKVKDVAINYELELELCYRSKLESINFLVDKINKYYPDYYGERAFQLLNFRIISNYISFGESSSLNFGPTDIGREKRRLKEMREKVEDLNLELSDRRDRYYILNSLQASLDAIENDIENDFEKITVKNIVTQIERIRQKGISHLIDPSDGIYPYLQFVGVFGDTYGLTVKDVVQIFANGHAIYAEMGWADNMAIELLRKEAEYVRQYLGERRSVPQSSFENAALQARNKILNEEIPDYHDSAPVWASLTDKFTVGDLADKSIRERDGYFNTEAFISEIERIWEYLGKIDNLLGHLYLKTFTDPDDWQSWAVSNGYNVYPDGSVKIYVSTSCRSPLYRLKMESRLSEFGTVLSYEPISSDEYVFEIRIQPANLMKILRMEYFRTASVSSGFFEVSQDDIEQLLSQLQIASAKADKIQILSNIELQLESGIASSATKDKIGKIVTDVFVRANTVEVRLKSLGVLEIIAPDSRISASIKEYMAWEGHPNNMHNIFETFTAKRWFWWKPNINVRYACGRILRNITLDKRIKESTKEKMILDIRWLYNHATNKTLKELAYEILENING